MIEHPEDPKDDGTKVPGFTYAWMIPYITRIGRRHGYAIAVHGSMGRDLDLVAIPWVPDANSAEALVSDVAKLTNGRIKRNDGTLCLGECDDNCGTPREHGRMAYTIIFKGACHYIDLSVMPKIPPQ